MAPVAVGKEEVASAGSSVAAKFERHTKEVATQAVRRDLGEGTVAGTVVGLAAPLAVAEAAQPVALAEAPVRG